MNDTTTLIIDLKNVLRKLDGDEPKAILHHKGYGNQWIEETKESLFEILHALETPMKMGFKDRFHKDFQRSKHSTQ